MSDFHFIPDKERLTMLGYKIMLWVQHQNVPIVIFKKLVQNAALYDGSGSDILNLDICKRSLRFTELSVEEYGHSHYFLLSKRRPNVAKGMEC